MQCFPPPILKYAETTNKEEDMKEMKLQQQEASEGNFQGHSWIAGLEN